MKLFNSHVSMIPPTVSNVPTLALLKNKPLSTSTVAAVIVPVVLIVVFPTTL